jgi:hypothetical protein
MALTSEQIKAALKKLSPEEKKIFSDELGVKPSGDEDLIESFHALQERVAALEGGEDPRPHVKKKPLTPKEQTFLQIIGLE